ncbi:MAG: glucosyltransferase domain-containing protein [Alphaproteobacteria bacterium]|nr:glucosyltransferase domain-containing protein [Alphaproteobacteria bacterium]
MNYLALEQKLINWYNNIPASLKKSFWISFMLINIAFLFHTANFMFGDHDWLYVKAETYWKEGTFEGRPLHFALQSILFSGQILPILNNLFSFFALTLSSIMLARYWNIPLTTLNYTLFASFVGTIPYTLVWLYYAKDALINLSLPLIVMTSLWLSKQKGRTKAQTLILHFTSIMVMLFAFSSYMAVINMVGICVLGAMIIDYAYHNKDVPTIIKTYTPTIVNVVIALILFQLYMKLYPITSSYNTKIIPLDFVAQKFFMTVEVMFKQFTAVLPFMEYKYKISLLIMTVLGLLSFVSSVKVSKLPLSILVLLVVLFVSKFAYFIADERGEILAEMEDFAFVPRLDFYGLVYVYALFLAFLLSLAKEKLQKVSCILVAIVIFMSVVRDTYALKTWKLGFDAEMKAHERIVSRLESHKNFRTTQTYKLLQIGTLSLRKNFYKTQPNEKIGLDLLETSFTPIYMSRIVYNFYYNKDIFHSNIMEYELSEEAKNFILYEAEAWPKQNSIYVDSDTVIIVLSEEGLEKSKQKIRQ